MAPIEAWIVLLAHGSADARWRRPIEALARTHVSALASVDTQNLACESRVFHLLIFLRSFRGVPACDQFAETWDPVIAGQSERGALKLKLYHENKRRDRNTAFVAGVTAVEKGFLHPGCADWMFLIDLKLWARDPAKWRLSARHVKRYKTIVLPYAKALASGLRAADAVNRKAGKL